jgi:hypothetical protein
MSGTRSLAWIDRAVMALAAWALLVGVAWAAPTSQQKNWVTYRSEQGNLAFEYPSGIFTEEKGDPTDALRTRTADRAGRVFTTRDGTAGLQIGTFPNLDNASVDEMRKRALAASYSDAKLDYNRSASNWYVLSGTRGKETFYERVHFSCSGRRLDIWAVTYPTAEASFYDDIVEEMHKRFRPILDRTKCG